MVASLQYHKSLPLSPLFDGDDVTNTPLQESALDNLFSTRIWRGISTATHLVVLHNFSCAQVLSLFTLEQGGLYCFHIEFSTCALLRIMRPAPVVGNAVENFDV